MTVSIRNAFTRIGKATLTAMLVPLFLLTFLLGSCQDDTVTTGTAYLRFSVDTLSFDTLFSGVGSTTAWVTVRNTGDKPVHIDRVRLLSGGATGFRFNLDGNPGPLLTDVRIPAKDSLYLFVALTGPEQGSTQPEHLLDAVVFESGADARMLTLEAWSWDAVVWRGKTIVSDTTLTDERPILLYDSLVVAEHVTLRLEAGTTLFLHDGARVLVYGRLDARGTYDRPVTFRGDRLDNVLPDLPYAYYPSQWYYIQLKAQSFNNVLDHVSISGGYYGLVADSSSTDRVKLTLTNSVVHNHTYHSLFSVCNKLVIGNTLLSNSGSYTVFLLGGEALFTHCTVANHVNLIAREGPALVLANALIDDKQQEWQYPLQAHFRNSIVMGSQADEIGLAFSDNLAVNADVYFSHSLLRTTTLGPGLQDSCVTATSARFMSLGAPSDRYVFDFRIDTLSPARNIGAGAYALMYPTDLSGRFRTLDEAPDAGAYEAGEQPEAHLTVFSVPIRPLSAAPARLSPKVVLQ